MTEGVSSVASENGEETLEKVVISIQRFADRIRIMLYKKWSNQRFEL